MSEQNVNIALYDERAKNEKDFYNYMKANEILSDAPDSSVYRYKGEAVFVGIGNIVDEGLGYTVFWGDYDSTIFREYERFPVDEQLKEFAWANIHYCAYFESNGEHCGCEQKNEKSISVFGKEFDNVCTSGLWFANPDADTLEKIYKLAEVWKLCIDSVKKV